MECARAPLLSYLQTCGMHNSYLGIEGAACTRRELMTVMSRGVREPELAGRERG